MPSTGAPAPGEPSNGAVRQRTEPSPPLGALACGLDRSRSRQPWLLPRSIPLDGIAQAMRRRRASRRTPRAGLPRRPRVPLPRRRRAPARSCRESRVARAQDGEGGARIAVLRLADRPAIHEQHAAVLVHPRLVGVAEDERVGLLSARPAARRARRACPRTSTRSPSAASRGPGGRRSRPTSKRRSKGSSRMKSFASAGRCARASTRPTLSELAVVLGDVRATAVLEVPSDGVVVVPVDRRDAALLDQPADLVGVRAVADEVAAAVDALDAQLLNSLERRLPRRAGSRGYR